MSTIAYFIVSTIICCIAYSLLSSLLTSFSQLNRAAPQKGDILTITEQSGATSSYKITKIKNNTLTCNRKG